MWISRLAQLILLAGSTVLLSSPSVALPPPTNTSCVAWLGDDPSLAGRDGIYWLDPDGAGGVAPFQAWCDMTTDGGGWTVIQHRESASDFYQPWTSYKDGFGAVTGNHWLGSDRIHALTAGDSAELYVDLIRHTGETRYARYQKFALSNEADGYRLALSGFSGTAGDSLSYHNGRRFSTHDRDNDGWGGSCAQRFKGAWWYGTCHQSNLNGIYHGGPHRSYADGVNWYHWTGHHEALTGTRMMLRGKYTSAVATPLAEWRMDELLWDGTADEVLDSSGNGIHAAAVAGADTDDASLCRGGNLSGAGDHVQTDALDLKTATLSMWIRPNHTKNDTRIASNVDPKAGPSGEQFTTRFLNSKIQIWSSAWKDVTSSSVAANQWTHIAIVINAGQATAYVNGKRELTQTDSYRLRKLGLGSRFVASGGKWGADFNGGIDEVVLYDKALTDSQVASVFDLQAKGKNLDGSKRSCPLKPGATKASCAAWLGDDKALAGRDGPYWLDPDGTGGVAPFQAWCDMTTDGGGWTVIQHRESASDFYRSWADYKAGFGAVTDNHWLGNDRIHALTGTEPAELYVDLTRSTGEKRYARYEKFRLSDEPGRYVLSLSGYSGTAGDSLRYHSGRSFSTPDRDNDTWGASCAQRFKGAWWYGSCHHSNLNGIYYGGRHGSYADGVNWYHWTGYHEALTKTRMMLRDDYSPAAPIAEWRMDEVSGADASDSSPNGRDLIASGGNGPNWDMKDGVVCGAANMSAVGDDLSAKGFNYNPSRFSVAFWLKPSALHDWSQAIGVGWGGRFLFHSTHDGSVYVGPDVRTRMTPAQLGKGTIELNAWQHVAFTFDNGLGRFYKNGKPLAKKSGMTTPVKWDRFGFTGTKGKRGLHGSIDELNVYLTTLTDDQVKTIYINQAAGKNADGTARICPIGVPDHFLIKHDGYGIHCAPEVMTVIAMDANGLPMESYTGTITLDTQTGKGGWTLASGKGKLVDSNPNDGVASYQFAAADEGIADFSLSYPEGQAIFDVDVFDGSVRDDDSEGDIAFAPSGFTVTASQLPNPPPAPISDPIGTQTASVPFALHLAAYGELPESKQCGVIETYAGTKAVAFWGAYVDPTSGTLAPRVDGSSISLTEAGAAVQKVAFASGRASVTVEYEDAGKIQVAMKDATLTGKQNVITGGSNAFVVRPERLVLSATTAGGVPNPGATGPGGAVFEAAGVDFVVRVEAQDADGDITPNFGNEISPEKIGLTHALVAPVGGAEGSLSSNLALKEGGVFSGDVSWNEVGIISLTGMVADGSYLGTGGLDATLGAVGRFVPDHFAIDRLDDGMFADACMAGGFTYTGEKFGYATGMHPTFGVTAQDASDGTTLNYSGAFAQLGPGSASVAEVTEDATKMGADGTTPVAIIHQQEPLTLVEDGGGTFTYTLGDDDFTHLRYANALVGAFDSDVELVITGVTDGDGVSDQLDASSLPALEPLGVNIRYGRLAAENTHGSELVDLSLPLSTQVYDESLGDFITHGDDQCTAAPVYTISDLSPGDGLDASALSASYTGGISSGRFDLVVLSPGEGKTGAALFDFTALPHLGWSWGDAADPNPTATVTFGIYAGDNPTIYLREVH